MHLPAIDYVTSRARAQTLITSFSALVALLSIPLFSFLIPDKCIHIDYIDTKETTEVHSTFNAAGEVKLSSGSDIVYGSPGNSLNIVTGQANELFF